MNEIDTEYTITINLPPTNDTESLTAVQIIAKHLGAADAHGHTVLHRCRVVGSPAKRSS